MIHLFEKLEEKMKNFAKEVESIKKKLHGNAVP